jgi:hypothetical protein
MHADARKALSVIRRCIASDRVRVLDHFTGRMDVRGLVWADVLALIDDPADVRGDGEDNWGRPRWIIAGRGAGEDAAGLVCVIGRDKSGDVTVFVTMFWGEP